MRRLSLACVVSLLLMLAQHGALLHQLGHMSHAASTAGVAAGATTLVGDLEQVDTGWCLTCEAFAQIANPAAAHAASVDVCRTALLTPPDPRYVIVACDGPTPRSRGPPQA